MEGSPADVQRDKIKRTVGALTHTGGPTSSGSPRLSCDGETSSHVGMMNNLETLSLSLVAW